MTVMLSARSRDFTVSGDGQCFLVVSSAVQEVASPVALVMEAWQR